jgi:hypothetical protein
MCDYRPVDRWRTDRPDCHVNDNASLHPGWWPGETPQKRGSWVDNSSQRDDGGLI